MLNTTIKALERFTLAIFACGCNRAVIREPSDVDIEAFNIPENVTKALTTVALIHVACFRDLTDVLNTILEPDIV